MTTVTRLWRGPQEATLPTDTGRSQSVSQHECCRRAARARAAGLCQGAPQLRPAAAGWRDGRHVERLGGVVDNAALFGRNAQRTRDNLDVRMRRSGQRLGRSAGRRTGTAVLAARRGAARGSLALADDQPYAPAVYIRLGRAGGTGSAASGGTTATATKQQQQHRLPSGCCDSRKAPNLAPDVHSTSLLLRPAVAKPIRSRRCTSGAAMIATHPIHSEQCTQQDRSRARGYRANSMEIEIHRRWPHL